MIKYGDKDILSEDEFDDDKVMVSMQSYKKLQQENTALKEDLEVCVSLLEQYIDPITWFKVKPLLAKLKTRKG